MLARSLRIRIRLWLQDRFPLQAIEDVLRHKVVPMHRHSVWYCLGGLLLFSFAVLVCSGMMLAVNYEVGMSTSPDALGSHGSVQRIVHELPHGWWIRSIHHWAGNVMIMAAFLHFFSVLLMKAYRRPKEPIWWTGLIAFCLILTSAFTGYLLPWSSLSMSSTRVGTSIIGSVPLAGPLIRDLLLAGPEVSEATLIRFFGIHVAVLPLLITTVVTLHVSMLLHQGSSVPASARACKLPGARLWSMHFWPEYSFHDIRTWVLVMIGVLTLAFVFPPIVGSQADPLTPAREGIKPAWYFLSLFRAFELLPDHVLGLENVQIGVMTFLLVGLVMALLPALHAGPVSKPRHRLLNTIRRRTLLILSGVLGWAAVTAPLRILAEHYWHDWLGLQAGTAANVLTLLAAVGWLGVAVAIDRSAEKYPHGASSLFGITLVSVVTGYTLWEALGPAVAVAILAVVHGVLGFAWATQHKAGWAANTVVVATVAIVAGMLALVIPLEVSHSAIAHAQAERANAVANVPPAVLPERRAETLGHLWFGLAVCAFLLVVVQSRISLTQKARDMGLFK